MADPIIIPSFGATTPSFSSYSILLHPTMTSHRLTYTFNFIVRVGLLSILTTFRVPFTLISTVIQLSFLRHTNFIYRSWFYLRLQTGKLRERGARDTMCVSSRGLFLSTHFIFFYTLFSFYTHFRPRLHHHHHERRQ